MEHLIILRSVLDTLENIELRGKDNHVRMVACMNALEQLIQEASQVMADPPVGPAQEGDTPAETPKKVTEGVGS